MNQNPNTTGRPSSMDGSTKKIADEAKQLANSTADQVKDLASNTVGQVKDLASNTLGQVKQQATKKIDSQKGRAVEKISEVASAVRAAGDSIEDGPLPDLAERAADGIEGLANYFKSRTVGDLIGEVERFGRREPAIFLGAAFALGLIGGRFLKSSSTGRARSPAPMFEDHFDDDLYGVDEHRYETMRGLDYVDRAAPPSPPPARVQVRQMVAIDGDSKPTTTAKPAAGLGGDGAYQPSTGNRGGGTGRY